MAYGGYDLSASNRAAQQAIDQGTSMGPSYSPIGSIGRALLGALGGYMQAKGQADYNKTLGDALTLGSDHQAEAQGPMPNGSAGYQTTVPGDQGAMIKALAANRDTAPLAMDLQMKQITGRQALADALAKARGEAAIDLEFKPQIAGATKQAETPAVIAQHQGTKQVDLAIDPQIAGAKVVAETPGLVNREALMTPELVKRAGGTAGASAAATLPYDFAKQNHAGDLAVRNAGPIAQNSAAGGMAAALAPVPPAVAAGAGLPADVTTMGGARDYTNSRSTAAGSADASLAPAPGGTVSRAQAIADVKQNPTDTQRGAAAYLQRIQSSQSIIDKIEGTTGSPNAGVSGALGKAAASLPIVGNMLSGETRQAYDTAKNQWITAKLRKESGAAISSGEYAKEDQQYFPQPGDSAATIAQKRAARAVVENGFKIEAGAAAPRAPAAAVAGPASPSAALPGNAADMSKLSDAEVLQRLGIRK